MKSVFLLVPDARISLSIFFIMHLRLGVEILGKFLVKNFPTKSPVLFLNENENGCFPIVHFYLH